jgi:hypothetical protein
MYYQINIIWGKIGCPPFQLGGHTKESDHDSSTFIDKDTLLQLSNIIESRL